MGTLVFQATLGGQVNLTGPNTASTFTISVPAVTGNMITSGDTGTVTNTMLASSAYTAPGTIGSGTPNTGAFTTLSASSTTTLSGGTANGVAYLNGSKVLTTGSALTFDGTNFGIGGASAGSALSVTKAKATAQFTSSTGTNGTYIVFSNTGGNNYVGSDSSTGGDFFGAPYSLNLVTGGAYPILFGVGNSEQMRLTSTGLGIGTSSPAGKLHAYSTDYTKQIAIFAGGGTVYGQIESSDANRTNPWYFGRDNVSTGNFVFSLSSSTKATLDTSGNLGLGVTPSAWAYSGNLQIKGGSAVSFASQYGGIYSNAYDNGGFKYIATAPANAIGFNNGQIEFKVAASGTAGNAISFTQAMTLDASGRLLLGTTSQSGTLTIQDIVTDGSYSATGVFKKASTNTSNYYIGGRLVIQNTSATAGNFCSVAFQTANNNDYAAMWGICSSHTSGTGAGSLAFGTSNNDGVAVERARIDASGNLLVGATSYAGVGISIATPDNNGCYSNSASTATRNHWRFANPNGVVGSIQTSASLTLYNTTSDYRLKTVVGSVVGHGERIDALQPIEYTWKADGTHTRGFLAHQFQEVYASSVSGTKDAVDEDGKPVYQAMQASTPEVIADLVAEIQSLRKRLAAAGIA